MTVTVISTENWKPGTLGEFRNLWGPLFSHLQSGRLLPAFGLREAGAGGKVRCVTVATR